MLVLMFADNCVETVCKDISGPSIDEIIKQGMQEEFFCR